MMPGMIAQSATALILFCGVLLTGCATPVGVNKVSPRQSYEYTTASPLNGGGISEQVKYVIHRYDLDKKLADDPAAVIADLHEKALYDERRDILYALAEVSYLYGGQLAKSSDLQDQGLSPDYFLLSALYAYYFFLEERSNPRPTALDRRARMALDLYNFGLWQGLATGDEGELALEGTTRKLPIGQLKISLDTAHFPWKMDDFEKFEAADKYEVRGVSVLNRTPGIGLPIVAVKKKSSDPDSRRQALPVTAFLRLQGNFASLSAGTDTASLELYSAQDSSTVAINNRNLPLETDTTTPLAYNLEGARIWSEGISVYLGRGTSTLPNGLYLQQPYRPGKIPVVFVHGTASSPVWWTEMFNTLSFDPLIRQKYQFWFFVYTSSEPIVMSAGNLRDALIDKVAKLDPEGKDPALQQMVVIGHSQGGILTKLCAVDTGDKLVLTMTGKDVDSLNMSEEKKVLVRHLLYVKPLPFVKEVVFLSTPHRGSFRSKVWIRELVKVLVTLPAKVVQTTTGYYDYMTDDIKRMVGGKKSIFTSADAQSPDNPMLKTLVEIPLSPGVKGHSIIAVEGDGDPKLGNDGVVEYSSAHLDGMESELIVRSDHSSQLNPIAIDEVRRILVEHARASSPDML